MRTIDISLTKTSIQKAINELEKTKRRIERGMKEVAKRLAEEGRNQAEMAFGHAVDVRVEEVDNGFVISANGDAVVFLEFGAGYGTDTTHPFASAMAKAEIMVEPKAYSITHANQFASKGYWYFGGRIYMSVQPMHGMLRAAEEIAYLTDRICKEVFGE